MDFLTCSLRNFSIKNFNGALGIDTGDIQQDFNLVFNHPVVSEIINSYRYCYKFGLDEIERLRNNIISVAVSEVSVIDDQKRRILVNNFHNTTQQFSNALWFIKDNPTTPYFATLSSDANVEPIGLRRGVYYSLANGKYTEKACFSIEEIKSSMEWFSLLNEFVEKKPIKEVDLNMEGVENMSLHLDFNIPSFQRAYYFLDNTRKTDFLPAKVAGYISVLEALYAVEGENKHKTSERTAFLIGESGEERIQIYKNVNDAYTARSKYVHGAFFTEKRNKTLNRVSEILDNYVRRVFKKMLLDYPELNYDSGNSRKVDDEFNKIILEG